MRYELRISGKGLLVLPSALAADMDIQDGMVIWLYVGALKSAVLAAIDPFSTSIVIGSDVAAELFLVQGWWMVRKEEMGLRFGPVIGVIANEYTKWPPSESNWARYLREIHGGLGILMTRESIEHGAQTVTGRILSADGETWVSGEYPRPDALYIQVYPLEISFKAKLDKIFAGKYFNCATHFNKWQIHQILNKDDLIRPYLPDTERFTDGSGQIQEWVSRWGGVYLKPILRSQGLGIIKVNLDGGSFLVKYREKFINCQQYVPVETSFREQFEEIMGIRQYIIQRAIELPEINGRTSDFRALVQRTGDGGWHVTALGGRLGSAGSIVNNLDSGGRRIPVAAIIDGAGMPKTDRAKEIFQLCSRVAVTLESNLGALGEIGLDLCIDVNGRMWIIEVNGRPDKTFFTTYYRESVARNAYRAPMLYSATLAGFIQSK